jgi:hypothetical protein
MSAIATAHLIAGTLQVAGVLLVAWDVVRLLRVASEHRTRAAAIEQGWDPGIHFGLGGAWALAEAAVRELVRLHRQFSSSAASEAHRALIGLSLILLGLVIGTTAAAVAALATPG